MSEPIPLSVSIAARVRGLAAERRVTQQQIADRLSISQAGISKRFRGTTPWRLDELAELALYLDVPLPSIFDGPLSAAS